MASLYDIKAEYESILQKANEFAIEHEGEIPDTLAAELDAISESLETKLCNCGFAYKNLDADCDMISLEIKRLQAKKKTLENQARWLKSYMSASMLPGTKFKTATISISWRPSVETVIIDESLIPESYFKVKREACKTWIKEAINEGLEVPGACLESKTNLVIS